MELKEEALMDGIAYYYPEGHSAHAEAGHPECPERVEAMVEALHEAGWWNDYPRLNAQEIPPEVLSSIHSLRYLRDLETRCRYGEPLDGDTYTTPASWQIAHASAGGAAAIAGAVWRREYRRGFALTRPPGHHAGRNYGMGFCLLNNIAIAAEYLIQSESAQRLAIIDFDLHHGNGTQDIFWERGDVFYLSTHQSPLYPGTGRIEETGGGLGRGTNVNIPLPPGSGDDAFNLIGQEILIPLLERFSPEMVLVSMGFDPHWRDPLGHLLLSAEGFRTFISRIVEWSEEACKGRVALFLEGGYDLKAAAACAQAAVAALCGYPWVDPLGNSPRQEGKSWRSVTNQVKNVWGLA